MTRVGAAAYIRVRHESRVALAAFGVLVAGMIATPLFETAGDERRVLASVVVFALFVTALSAAVHDHGRRALVAAALIVAFTFAVEIIGSKTGFPFGEYDYTGVLTPQLFGVPVIVSFAWAGITLTAHGALRDVKTGRIALMACAITAWDAFLDPQMAAEGYWQWQPASPSYRGIPLVNYLGWLLTASITSTIALVACGSARRDVRGKSSNVSPNDASPSNLPRVTYATLAVLSTIGFAVFFDDVVVALVGGVAMGAFVWLSFARRSGQAA